MSTFNGVAADGAFAAEEALGPVAPPQAATPIANDARRTVNLVSDLARSMFVLLAALPTRC
jgi:hypothetical protein